MTTMFRVIEKATGKVIATRETRQSADWLTLHLVGMPHEYDVVNIASEDVALDAPCSRSWQETHLW